MATEPSVQLSGALDLGAGGREGRVAEAVLGAVLHVERGLRGDMFICICLYVYVYMYMYVYVYVCVYRYWYMFMTVYHCICKGHTYS